MTRALAQEWPQPLEQHFSPREHSASAEHISLQMPTPPDDGGHDRYVASDYEHTINGQNTKPYKCFLTCQKCYSVHSFVCERKRVDQICMCVSACARRIYLHVNASKVTYNEGLRNNGYINTNRAPAIDTYMTHNTCTCAPRTTLAQISSERMIRRIF